MKKLLMLFGVSLLAGSLFAGNGYGFFTAPPNQGGELAFGQQKIVFTAGYGMGNLRLWLWSEFSDELNFSSSALGPLHFRGEVGISDNVGIGLSVNHMTLKQTWDGDSGYYYKYTFNTTNYLLRFNFHFSVTETVDPYFGIGAGYASNVHKFESNDPYWDDSSVSGMVPFGFEMAVGVRYYFIPNFGIYGEIGLGKSIMNGGIALAF
ncbi:MAG: hypothetical protein IT233_05200 [Bacteroidia bacterium]|nr:hypothetical protein [Bacteroidia bacterium]